MARQSLVGVGLRRARLGRKALDAHAVREFGLAVVERAADRRRVRGVGRARERDVAFARQESGRGIEPDPAGARDVHLGPGVQVGEVLRRPCRAFERAHVGLQLDQVSGDEARREPEVAEDLREQPGGIAARPVAERERLLAALDAGLDANTVGDVPLQPLIHLDEKIDRRPRRPTHLGEPGAQARPRRLEREIGRDLGGERRIVAEGELLRRRVEEEVERVHHREVGDQLDRESRTRGSVTGRRDARGGCRRDPAAS